MVYSLLYMRGVGKRGEEGELRYEIFSTILEKGGTSSNELINIINKKFGISKRQVYYHNDQLIAEKLISYSKGKSGSIFFYTAEKSLNTLRRILNIYKYPEIEEVILTKGVIELFDLFISPIMKKYTRIADDPFLYFENLRSIALTCHSAFEFAISLPSDELVNKEDVSDNDIIFKREYITRKLRLYDSLDTTEYDPIKRRAKYIEFENKYEEESMKEKDIKLKKKS